MQTILSNQPVDTSRRRTLTGLIAGLGLCVLLAAPPANAALRAAAAAQDAVTLTWTAPGDDGSSGTAAQYDVRYSTVPINATNWDIASQAVNEPSPQAAGSAESFTVSGLAPGTTYYFAIKVADEVPNWSGLSNIITATTDPETEPPAAIANLNPTGATATTVDLAWTAPGDDGTTGTATEYDIRYATSLTVLENWDNAVQVTNEPSPSAAGSSETFTVTGLTPSTTYYFGVKTADEIPNWSTISNVATTSTGVETDAPAAIANLLVVLPTETSLSLIWTAPGDDGTTGTASEYDIRYSTSTINGSNWDAATQITGEPSPSPAGTPETLTVENLSAATTYYFAIKTADEVPNWSDLSNIASGLTENDQTPPAAINDLQAEEGPVNGSISLSWTAPGDDGLMGTATYYEIRYAYDSLDIADWNAATAWSFTPAPLASGLTQTATVANLVPGDVYYLGIKAYDDAGNVSPASNCDSAIAKYELVLDVDEDEANLPDQYQLSQNYPNPFNPTTEILVSLPQAADANLIVYNSVGQEVATLIDNRLSPGEHVVQWDGTDQSGQQVATGVYYYRLAAGDYIETKKMMMLK